VPVGQNSEAVSTSSENTNPDVCKVEGTSDDCQFDQQRTEQCDNAEKQSESEDVSALSQSQSNETLQVLRFTFVQAPTVTRALAMSLKMPRKQVSCQ